MDKTGIILVDHGSRRAESNQLLEEVARLFAARFAERYEIIEPAHMELSEPSIDTAYARCVERGAVRVVVCPLVFGWEALGERHTEPGGAGVEPISRHAVSCDHAAGHRRSDSGTAGKAHSRLHGSRVGV